MLRFKHIRRLLLVLAIIIMVLPIPAQAQDSLAYGIFFYSPSCGHCHEVINNHWPSIDAEFGDQLRVMFLDVSTPQGAQIMQATRQAMNIQSNGVPMLILGDQVLVGSVQIPQQAPTIIREGLASGGVAQPPVPGIGQIFEMAFGHLELDAAAAPAVDGPNLLDDPANLLAIVILFGLIGNLGIIGAAVWRGINQEQSLLRNLQGRTGWALMLVGTVLGIGLATTLLLGTFNNTFDDGLPLVLSGVVLLIFLALAFALFNKPSLNQITGWTVPLILTAGLLVAGYLAYVEVSLAEATCGVIGDCNTVQQSVYARIFGVPVGVIGIIGYVAMLVVWAVNQYSNRREATWLLFGMAVAGTLVSIYLTFLEPFIIGASCAWCLTSAVIMTLLLWLLLPTRELLPSAQKRRGR